MIYFTTRFLMTRKYSLLKYLVLYQLHVTGDRLSNITDKTRKYFTV